MYKEGARRYIGVVDNIASPYVSACDPISSEKRHPVYICHRIMSCHHSSANHSRFFSLNLDNGENALFHITVKTTFASFVSSSSQKCMQKEATYIVLK
jgi:hypothetical protein